MMDYIYVDDIDIERVNVAEKAARVWAEVSETHPEGSLSRSLAFTLHEQWNKVVGTLLDIESLCGAYNDSAYNSYEDVE